MRKLAQVLGRELGERAAGAGVGEQGARGIGGHDRRERGIGERLAREGGEQRAARQQAHGGGGEQPAPARAHADRRRDGPSRAAARRSRPAARRARGRAAAAVPRPASKSVRSDGTATETRSSATRTRGESGAQRARPRHGVGERRTRIGEAQRERRARFAAHPRAPPAAHGGLPGIARDDGHAVFEGAAPKALVREIAARSAESVMAPARLSIDCANAASLRAEAHSTDHPPGAPRAGVDATGACSSTTCTLVPPMPNELTPARRGCVDFHVRARPPIASGVRSSRSNGFGVR
jgi:hypothetical protein